MASSLFRTSNPAFRGDAFAGAHAPGAVMTLNGTINKTGFLFLGVVGGAMWTWHLFTAAGGGAAGATATMPWMIGGLLGGFITAMVTIFKKTWAPVTAPLYAILEGLALGGISAAIEQTYPGIAMQAVAGTFGAFAIMLALYWTGAVRATPAFVRGVIVATGAVAIIYIVDLVMGMFGSSVAFIHGSGGVSIAFSVVVVAIAALNLVLDFGMIEQGVREGAPKYMEWYGGFALMVTLIWLYLEILRLLAKMRNR